MLTSLKTVFLANVFALIFFVSFGEVIMLTILTPTVVKAWYWTPRQAAIMATVILVTMIVAKIL